MGVKIWMCHVCLRVIWVSAPVLWMRKMCLIVAEYALEHVFCVVADVFRERLQLHDTGLS